MRHVLGSVVLTAALVLAAGCGDDSTTAGDTPPARAPSSESTSAPSSDSSTSAPAPASSSPVVPAYQVVELVTATAAGGTVGDAAALTDESAASAFISQFDQGTMTDRLQQLFTTTEAPAGTVQYAAVVSIGCDVPTDVTVDETAGGLQVQAAPTKTSGVQCLAPMTTVAFLLVPADAVA